MGRLSVTVILAITFVLALGGIVILGTQLLATSSGKPGAAPRPTSVPTTRAVSTVVPRSDACQVGPYVRRHVKSSVLSVANDPLTVRAGQHVCLEVFTVPHTTVEITISGNVGVSNFSITKQGLTNTRGEMGRFFTMPAVVEPTTLVYICTVSVPQAKGAPTQLEGRERFRVVPA